MSAPTPSPEPGGTTEDEPMPVAVGEPLLSDYGVHDCPCKQAVRKVTLVQLFLLEWNIWKLKPSI